MRTQIPINNIHGENMTFNIIKNTLFPTTKENLGQTNYTEIQTSINLARKTKGTAESDYNTSYEEYNTDTDNTNTQEQAEDNLEINDFNTFNEKMPLTAHIYKSQTDKKEEQEQNLLTAERITLELARQQQIKFTHAAFAISDLYQKGAHLKNVQNRTTFINGLAITKQNITQAMIRINSRITHRAVARALRDIILQASRLRQVPGNLFAQYKTYLLTKEIVFDEATLEEHSYYCTDFHIDNPNTPLEVARFLNTRARTRNTSKKK
jgi:hypothetical protein